MRKIKGSVFKCLTCGHKWDSDPEQKEHAETAHKPATSERCEFTSRSKFLMKMNQGIFSCEIC